jgi:cobalamin synthase
VRRIVVLLAALAATDTLLVAATGPAALAVLLVVGFVAYRLFRRRMLGAEGET